MMMSHRMGEGTGVLVALRNVWKEMSLLGKDGYFLLTGKVGAEKLPVSENIPN